MVWVPPLRGCPTLFVIKLTTSLASLKTGSASFKTGAETSTVVISIDHLYEAWTVRSLPSGLRSIFDGKIILYFPDVLSENPTTRTKKYHQNHRRWRRYRIIYFSTRTKV